MTAPGTDPSPMAWAWARVLGALQESQRLGHTRVEVGHLLLTVYADPLVRSVLVRGGLDLRDVQQRVGKLLTPDDVVLITDRTSPPVVTGIAADAVEILQRLGTDLSPGTSTGPSVPGPSFAAVHRALAMLLLGEDAPPSVEALLGDLLPAAARLRIAGRLATMAS